MKFISLIFLSFFITQKMNAQMNYERNDLENLIDSSISIVFQSFRNSTYKVNDSIVVLRDNNSNWSVANVNIKNFYNLDIYDPINRKILEHGIFAWKVYPELKGKSLEISIGFYVVHYKDNDFYFGRGGGAKVVFEYSCKKRRWIFKSMKR